MGKKPSPYGAVQNTRRLLDIILGDPLDPDNVFGWDHVVENLPGMSDYKPWEPNISKRTKDGCIALDSTDYIDDMRRSGPMLEKTHGVAGKIGKKSAHHGCQVSAKKYCIKSL
mmetsp:Transcript_23493/g.35678  ORF Transcript_23493/g.35678 Transcript_23493/m.35678 type:complete len:113 (-) Transcript_23493:1899-2237(-)